MMPCSSNSAPVKGKQTKGRQKIAIKRVEKESKRQVTFSKRKSGLIAKASELCILCGARIALIIVSDAGKLFTFGHPDVEIVVHSYLAGVIPSASPPPQIETLVEHHKGVCNVEIEKLETEKTRATETEHHGWWWEQPVEEIMDVEELETFAGALEELRFNLSNRVDELVAEETKPFEVDDEGFCGGGGADLGFLGSSSELQNGLDNNTSFYY